VLRAHPRVSETVVVHHEVIEGCVGGEAPPDVSELLVWCEERKYSVNPWSAGTFAQLNQGAGVKIPRVCRTRTEERLSAVKIPGRFFSAR
jgi:hypothetical protein